MPPTILLVAGMMRSGSTLLGRMLDVLPEVSVATDPYLPFFNMFRSHIARKLGQEIPPEAMLEDYYFSAPQLNLFRAIQAATLNEEFPREGLPWLRSAIRTFGTPWAPVLMHGLDSIDGGTYAEVFQSLVDLIQTSYGTGQASVVGFKEVWGDELIPAIARSFPNARFIQIIRDPRAVAASQNARPGKYPWLLMARHWRKLVALAWQYERLAELRDRVLVLHYRELVTEPEQSAHHICEFLDVPFRSEMVDPESFTDDSGQPWRQNTAVGQGRQEFDLTPLERWRSQLTHDEARVIEFACAPEMRLHGYEVDMDGDGADREFALRAPFVEPSRLGRWIGSVTDNDPLTNAVELTKEQLRYTLLGLPDDEAASVSKDLVEGCFLLTDIYRALRSVV